MLMGGGIVTMKRISVRRVASVIVTAMAMTLVFATLGWAMMPQWNTRPYTKHIVIASADTTITPAHANIPHEGRYRTRETRLSIKTGDGVTLPAVLREPVGAPGPRRLVCSFTGPVPVVPRISAISPTPWPLPVS